VRCGNDEKLFADFFPEKKHFRKVNLSFSSSRFQKADDLQREKEEEEEEEEEEEKDAYVDRNKTRKPKCCRKASFVLTVLLVVGNLVGQLVRWFVADSLPDFRNVKRPYIQCHFQLAVAHYDVRVFWIEQFLSLNASLQSKQNLKLKVHENLLWWVGVLDMAAASCVAYFFPFPLFISLSLLHSCSLSLSLVLSYLNLKTCIFSMQPAGYKCYNFQN
jgi:hypothetical protein